jgi:hypothetical protein
MAVSLVYLVMAARFERFLLPEFARYRALRGTRANGRARA